MNVRGCAAQILARVLNQGQSLTAALDAQLPKLKDHHDRAFVQALCYGVIRHYYTLDCVLSVLVMIAIAPTLPGSLPKALL